MREIPEFQRSVGPSDFEHVRLVMERSFGSFCPSCLALANLELTGAMMAYEVFVLRDEETREETVRAWLLEPQVRRMLGAALLVALVSFPTEVCPGEYLWGVYDRLVSRIEAEGSSDELMPSLVQVMERSRPADQRPQGPYSVRIKQQGTGAWAGVRYYATEVEGLAYARGSCGDYVWAVFRGRTKVVDSRG